MYAFGIKLALLEHFRRLRTPDESLIIAVDDCDAILGNEASINIIKNILEGERTYKYEKNMTMHLATLPKPQAQILKTFMNPQSVGFEVDCSKFIFIFTSNKTLPSRDEVMKKPSAINNHLHAIRSRCHYNDFNTSWDKQWGWLADVVLNSNVKEVEKLTLDQKTILLDWMYNNWKNMTESSIRTTEKMAQVMLKK